MYKFHLITMPIKIPLKYIYLHFVLPVTMKPERQTFNFELKIEMRTH